MERPMKGVIPKLDEASDSDGMIGWLSSAVRRALAYVVVDLLGIEGASSQEGTAGTTHVSSSCDTKGCADGATDVAPGADIHESSS